MREAASPPSRLLLRVEEAADALGVSRTLLYELLARGEIASVRIGRARRVPAAALDAYVERLQAENEDSLTSGGR